jgi:hypothetical protein
MGDILSDFFSSLVDWFQYILFFILGMIQGIFEALISIIQFIFFKLYDIIITVLESLLDLAGITEKLDLISTSFTGGLGYFFDLFLIPQGLTTLISAYFIRFLIRRLPVIG